MNILLLFFLPFFLAQPLAAQTVSAKGLSETEKVGLRLFVQRCSVCHLAVPQYKPYAPLLDQEVVKARGDDAIRKFILQGSPRMPGFQYNLKPPDIDQIISYLKTVRREGATPAASRSQDILGNGE